MIQPTLIDLHLNEYNQELHYYPLTVKLDRYLDGLSSKVRILKKLEV